MSERDGQKSRAKAMLDIAQHSLTEARLSIPELKPDSRIGEREDFLDIHNELRKAAEAVRIASLKIINLRP